MKFWVVITWSFYIWGSWILDCKWKGSQEGAMWRDGCVQFGLQTREERRDQEDNCMQAWSQGRSATPSSNTHSGWASSHYSPTGAKLHLPHALTTAQSPFTHPQNYAYGITRTESGMLQKHRRWRLEAGERWESFHRWMKCRHQILSNYRAPQQARHRFNSHDHSGWLGMRKHVPHGWWHNCVFCQINMCTEKQAAASVNGFPPRLAR